MKLNNFEFSVVTVVGSLTLFGAMYTGVIAKDCYERYKKPAPPIHLIKPSLEQFKHSNTTNFSPQASTAYKDFEKKYNMQKAR